MYNFTPESAKELIEKYFSLQWCRDNLTIPISIESNPSTNNDIFWIAIANYSYLGTIASPIKDRIKQNRPNIEVIFIEKSIEQIEEMLDEVSPDSKNTSSETSSIYYGERGGRYTEDITKDGRPYRRYF